MAHTGISIIFAGILSQCRGKINILFYVLYTNKISHDKKNMTVNELAKRLGMNRRYVNQVVTGSKPGSYHLYVRIAEALGVPLAALFDDYPLSRLDG